MPDHVIIFDTTLRDGEQSPGCSMTTPEKLKVAEALVELGVDVIEAGFPITSPGDFESVRAIGQKFGDRATICGLARCRRLDIERAAEALKGIAKPRIHVFLATSPIHREFKLKMAEREIVKTAVEHVKLAKSFFEDIEFSPEDAARTELDFLAEVVEKAIEAGATTVNIPDTVGYATPTHYFKVISHLKQHVSNIDKAVISTHCHNDLGLAVANSLAAVEAGARQVECTINGLGERAGNAALEEIVMALKTRKDYYGVETRINTPKLCGASRLVSSITGMLVQRNKAIVGQNAFAHEAGIHQDGILKERSTYEIMRAEDVGYVGANLVLGKHSGRAAIRSRVIELGYQLDEAQIETVYKDFIALADKKKDIYDADIVALIDNRLTVTTDRWELVRFHIAAGTGTIPTATVELRDLASTKPAGLDGVDESTTTPKTHKDASIGDGPVDAVCKAMERIVGINAELKDYQVRAVSGGEDAQGEASVAIVYHGRRYHGKAVSTDVIEASALAYLKALNKVLRDCPTEKALPGV
ncbi:MULTISPECIES: 2-isopropylmalate synthase [unclassified Schlesneria]|uniref:2-isopropylmalate synthase n=1 Tax=unclassified Schlesneria TaxID=2762017 RepID=UPI002EEC4938